MPSLIWKDLVAAWQWDLLTVFAMMVYLGGHLWTPGMYLMVALIFSLALAAIPLIVEYKYETGATFLSLPVSRLEVVAARYGYSLIAVLGASLLSFGLAMVLVRGFGIETVAWSRWLDIRVFLGLGVTALLYLSLYLPFHFRYGPGGAVLGFSFAAIGVSFAVLGLLRLRASLWDAASFARILREGIMVPGVAGSLGILLLGWIPASVALSVRFYERREF